MTLFPSLKTVSIFHSYSYPPLSLSLFFSFAGPRYTTRFTDVVVLGLHDTGHRGGGDTDTGDRDTGPRAHDGGGRIAIFGDSNCIDDAYGGSPKDRRPLCTWLVELMLNYVILGTIAEADR